MFLADYFKGINSFDYLEEIEQVSYEYTTQVFKELFEEKKMVLSSSIPTQSRLCRAKVPTAMNIQTRMIFRGISGTARYYIVCLTV